MVHRLILLCLLSCLYGSARGQTFNYRYWLDGNDATAVMGTADYGAKHIECDFGNMLQSGTFHTLYMQVVDENGVMSMPTQRTFYCMLTSDEQPQQIVRGFYWFDKDSLVHQMDGATAGVFSLDASHLADGFHTLYYQLEGSNHVFSMPQARMFYKLTPEGPDAPEHTIRRGLYWFDKDSLVHQMDGATAGIFSLDASHLADGFHTLYYQLEESDYVFSMPQARMFYKLTPEGPDPPEHTIRRGFYWFDKDSLVHQMDGATAGLFSLDASHLADGFHTLYYQLEGSDHVFSMPQERTFYKIGLDELEADAGTTTFSYWIDNDSIPRQKNMALGNGILIDMSDVDKGFHTLYCRIENNLGATFASRIFYIDERTIEELRNLNTVFSIDKVALPTIANSATCGKFHYDIDASTLSDGFHRIDCYVTDGYGKTSSCWTSFFLRTSPLTTDIASYKYWLNECDSLAHYKKLNQTASNYRLVSLLPVEQQPLRSSLFHFEVKDGQPMLYGKNDFHIRFYDGAGRFTDATEQYIDYNVSQKVEDVEWLESGVRATTDRPEENEIKWYCLEAEYGDSLIFKSNMACSIQLFSPSGREVLSVSGNESVRNFGCHVFDDGTYYLALHDVTGTSNQNVMLDYQKIDRFAVLAYSPKTLSVPSIANISINGNGLTDSTEVSLVLNETIVKASNVHAEDLGHLTADILLEDIPFGAYDLRVKFTKSDSITIMRGFKIEKADSLSDVTIALIGSGSVMRGRVVNYQLRFTNNSNLPVLSLPFTLTIDCGNSIENLTGLKFETDFKKQAREIIRKAYEDVCTPAELVELENAVLGDDDLSMFYADTITTPGKAYLVGNFVLPRLDGNSTMTIPFSIWCNELNNIILYAYTIPQWNIYEYIRIIPPEEEEPDDPENPNPGGQEGGGTEGSDSGNSGSGTGESGNTDGSGGSLGGGSTGSQGGGTEGMLTLECKDVCGPKLAYDCISALIESGPAGDVKELIKDCAMGHVQDIGVGAIFDYLCDGKMPDFSRLQLNPIPVLTEAATNFIASGARCIGLDVVKRIVGKKVYKTINVGYNCLYTPIRAWMDACSYTSSSLPVSVVNSCEPNDMLGYVAESGSHAIKDGLTDVWYTIQFENDTVFATAPAHDIYLTDTLDVNLFDLSTYRPTKIIIGEKSMELTGERNFISTLDMRPEINAIAQIEGTIDDETGIVRWHISSLDPMTMEPTDDVMQGVLPVNFDGSGLGEASYEISLRKDLPHGTEIPNRSGNIFDYNETVLTPTWTNVIDKIAPVSHITDVVQQTDSTAMVSIEATDDGSGPWRYDVYVQYGSGAYFKTAENVPVDTTATVKIYPGIEHNFYVVATDSAGNMEAKVPECEFTLVVGDVKPAGDVNNDGMINITDAIGVVNYILKNRPSSFVEEAADVNNDGIINMILRKSALARVLNQFFMESQ